MGLKPVDDPVGTVPLRIDIPPLQSIWFSTISNDKTGTLRYGFNLKSHKFRENETAGYFKTYLDGYMHDA